PVGVVPRPGAGGARPPEQGADPGHQLAEGERLGAVVVGAHLGPAHPVDLGVAGGEHEDRHLADGPDPAAHVPAVEGREHQVEHDQVGPLGLEVAHGLAAVGGRPPLAPLARQRLADRLEQRPLVADDHDLGHAPNIPLQVTSGQRPTGNLHCPFAFRPPPRPPAVRPAGTMTSTNNASPTTGPGGSECAPPSNSDWRAWKPSCSRWASSSRASSTAPWRRWPASTPPSPTRSSSATTRSTGSMSRSSRRSCALWPSRRRWPRTCALWPASCTSTPTSSGWATCASTWPRSSESPSATR